MGRAAQGPAIFCSRLCPSSSTALYTYLLLDNLPDWISGKDTLKGQRLQSGGDRTRALAPGRDAGPRALRAGHEGVETEHAREGRRELRVQVEVRLRHDDDLRASTPHTIEVNGAEISFSSKCDFCNVYMRCRGEPVGNAQL